MLCHESRIRKETKIWKWNQKLNRNRGKEREKRQWNTCISSVGRYSDETHAYLKKFQLNYKYAIRSSWNIYTQYTSDNCIFSLRSQIHSLSRVIGVLTNVFVFVCCLWVSERERACVFCYVFRYFCFCFCFNFQWVFDAVCRATRHYIVLHCIQHALHTSKLLIFIVHYLASSAKQFLKCMSLLKFCTYFCNFFVFCFCISFRFSVRFFLFSIFFSFSLFSLLTLNQNYLTFSGLCLPSPCSFSIHLIFICLEIKR